VIVPAHDVEDTIRPTLRGAEEAVAALRGRPGWGGAAAEVIVVDDGSRDGTLAAVLDVTRNNRLFRVLHRPEPSSPGCARNSGVAAATGELLFFLDGDDLFLPDHLVECGRALADPAVDLVKTGVALADPVHPEWRDRIRNSLVLNLAVRRRCHDFIGGFPDEHLFRRTDRGFEHRLDIFRLIEDVHYNALLSRFFRRVDVAAETVRYVRRPGNSYDRQYEKFQHPVGAFREETDPEFDLRVRLSKVLVEHHASLLERRRPTPAH
jgi:glycosyltransferase involved in cell wall biosynthesis